MQDVITRLETGKDIDYLGFMVKALDVENIGPIREKFSCEFGKGINVIVGHSASGKTTLLKTISNTFKNESKDIFDDNSSIKLDLYNEKTQFQGKNHNVKSILIDNIDIFSDDKIINDLIKHLQKFYNNPQIIITSKGIRNIQDGKIINIKNHI